MNGGSFWPESLFSDGFLQCVLMASLILLILLAFVYASLNTGGLCSTCVHRVATGQGKVTEIQGQGKVREFCAGSGKLEILRKVREIQENPLKVREI